MGNSVYLLQCVPLRDQVSNLLDRQLVEEAVLLAETIAAVDGAKNKEAADEVCVCVGGENRSCVFSGLGIDYEMLGVCLICTHTHTHTHTHTQYMSEVKQRSAFIYLGSGRYSEAEALFVESGCDPREVSHMTSITIM